MNKKVLLIQIRDSNEIASHEHQCFTNALREAEGVSLDKVNIYKDRIGSDDVLKRFDALMIGGSHHAPKDNFPERDRVEYLIEKSIDSKKPFLGVCYGFEILLDTLGGEIIQDETKGCFGTEKINLTDEGREDLLLSNMPDEFFVQEAHEWLAASLPEGVTNLAYSKHVPYQTVRVNNLPAYGVQFHPEFTGKEILKRMKLNQKRNREHFNNKLEILTDVKPSPHSVRIILNFVKKVMNADLVVE